MNPANSISLGATGTQYNFGTALGLKVGDVLRVNSSNLNINNVSATKYLYVIGTGPNPGDVQLATNVGALTAITDTTAASGTLAIQVLKASDFNNPLNWDDGVVPTAPVFSTHTNTGVVAFTKDTSINSLTLSGAGNSLALVSSVPNYAKIGPWTKLTFSGASPTINVSGGASLFLSDAQNTPLTSFPGVVTPSTNGSRLVVAGSNGLTINNSNAMFAFTSTDRTPIKAATATTPTTDSITTGAVKLGGSIDWQRFSGTLTLAKGAFGATPQRSNPADGGSPLPLRNTVVLGSGTDEARLELFGNNGVVMARGLNGNSASSIYNSAASGGGPQLTLGSYGEAMDSFDFAGTIGGPIATASTDTPSNLYAVRVVKIGPGTQVLSGANSFLNSGQTVAVNGGTLSLGTTGTLGVVSGTGQASLPTSIFTVGSVNATTGAGVNAASASTVNPALVIHNGEFKIEGTDANARSQGFGQLVMASSSLAQNTLSGYGLITLAGTGNQPISMTFTNAGIAAQPALAPRNVSATVNANGQTALFRGNNLGVGGANDASIKFIGTGTFAPTITGTSADKTLSVLKGALADTSATGNGRGFATYDSTNGVRLLADAEQETTYGNITGAGTIATTNYRFELTGASSSVAGVTSQTLEIRNTTGAAASINNTGTALLGRQGILFSGTGDITLTGNAIVGENGTVSTNREDVVIHAINTGKVRIETPITNGNAAAANAPWVAFSGPSNYEIAGAITLTNSSNGGVAFNGTGTTTVTAPITMANTGSTIAVNRGTVVIDGVTVSNNPTLVLAGGATLDLSGTSQSFSTISNDAQVTFTTAGAVMSGGNITNSKASFANLTIASASSAQYAGVISGNINLIVSGATESLYNVHTYTGSTRVDTGTLNVARQGNLPSGTSVVLGTGTTSTGQGGILQLGDPNASGHAVEQEIAKLTVAPTAVGTANAVNGVGSNISTLIINYTDTGSPDSFSGKIGNNATVGNVANNLALVKKGAGTLLLTNVNNYVGDTTVLGGAFGGTGSIVSATTFAAGTTLTPGASAGTFTIINSLTLDPATTLAFELLGTNTTAGGGVNDLVDRVTNLTLDGTLNVSELVAGSFLGAVDGNKWRLINYTGTLTNNGLNLGSMPALASGLHYEIDTATTGQVNLVVLAPEPATLGLLGAASLLCLRRRK
ncbi:MAG: autotransporter-associated beta strand repeat-containing protein [Tepidisphaeraceae bacterium]